MHLPRLMTVAALLLSSTLLFAAEDWAQWQGPTRDNKSPDKGLLQEWPEGGPKLVWKYSGIGTGFSCVAVANGIVYATGDVDKVLTIFAFDITGKLLWKAPHGSGYNVEGNYPGARSMPVIDGGNLYLLSGVGLVGCFDAKTGEKKWTRDIVKEFGGKSPNWGYAESVTIYNDMALVTPGGKNCMVALNKNTGQTLWTSTGFDAPAHYCSILPIEFEGIPLLVQGTEGGIFAVDARNGKTQWSNRFAAGNVASIPTPAYADGYVFWSVGYGKGAICLKLKKQGDGVSADVAWQNRDMVCHHGGYFILDGYVYGNHNAGWTCLDLKTGEKKWFNRGVGKGSVIYADGRMVLFGEGGGKVGLAAFSPTNFEMKGQFAVEGEGPSWAHPVLIGNRLYIRYDKNLYVFDVKAQ